MSEEANIPTQDQLREARHAGFVDSMSQVDSEKAQRLADAYGPQDARREQNINGFYASIRGEN